MKFDKQFFIAFAALFILANWSEQESNVDSTEENKINFYGTLTTREGNSYEVDNIDLNGKYNQIAFFEMVRPQEEGPNRLQLPNNPQDSLTTKIDLAEGIIITVPEPEILWTYTNKGRSHEYIEVSITSKSNTKQHYLYPCVEGRKDLHCRKKDVAKSKVEINIRSIKELKIEGFTNRECKKQPPKPDECPCPNAK